MNTHDNENRPNPDQTFAENPEAESNHAEQDDGSTIDEPAMAQPTPDPTLDSSGSLPPDQPKPEEGTINASDDDFADPNEMTMDSENPGKSDHTQQRGGTVQLSDHADSDASEVIQPSEPANDQTVDVDSAKQNTDMTVDVAGEAAASIESDFLDQTGAMANEENSDATGAWDGGTDEIESDKTGVHHGLAQDTNNPTRVDRDLPLTAKEKVDMTEEAGGRKPTAQQGNRKKKEIAQRGQVIAGYEILDELGRGGMGVVYKARQQQLNRVVALKMVLAGSHASAEQLLRFRIEAEAVATLSHPNIVQVYEVGEDDNCPFFSLEFVDGHPLDRIIDGRAQDPRAAAKLVMEIAQGMEAAHRQGIIHRDLKPANILVGHDGVPKITDFGLAKRFDDDEGHGATKSGAIMGTPSYMAPEQALGRTKDTRPPADIYSLGAILYDMMTGRPPHRGNTLLETLQQVQKVDPVPPRKLRPEMPRDLEVICLKALQKAPEKRYETAGALAEDLRRYLSDEPITARPTPWYEHVYKYAKRHPAQTALYSVSLLALVIVLTLGGFWLDSERRAAEREEEQQRKLAQLESNKRAQEKKLRLQAERDYRRAERNFQKAMQAVDEMLSLVGQERLANIPQMGPVRRELLEQARNFYREFLEEKSTDPAVQREMYRAQFRVADVDRMLGKTKAAEKNYRVALANLEDLAAKQPGNVDVQQDMADIANNLGNLLENLDRLPEAEKMYQKAMTIVENMPGSNPARQQKLGSYHNNFGAVMRRMGNNESAEKSFEESIDIYQQLAKRFPTKPKLREELARSLSNLGAQLITDNQINKAEDSLVRAQTILNELTEKQSNKAEYQAQLARTLSLLGAVRRDKQPKRAEVDYREALKVRKKLADDFPSTPDYRRDLANTYSDLAILLRATDRPQKADEMNDEALSILEKTVADFPDLPSYRQELASRLQNRGVFLLARNQLPEAETVLDKSQRMYSALAKKHPKVLDYRKQLGQLLVDVATLKMQQGKLDDANQLFDKAVHDLQKLADSFPTDKELKYKLALAHHRSGVLSHSKSTQHLATKGAAEAKADFDKADQHYKEAGQLWTKLTEKSSKIDHRKFLGEALRYRGALLLAHKRPMDAEKIWQNAVAHYTASSEQFPDREDIRVFLAESYGNLGLAQQMAGSSDAAKENCKKAIDLLEKWKPELPLNQQYYRQLLIWHTNYANLSEKWLRPNEAETSLLRMLEIEQQMVKKFPKDAMYRRDMFSTAYRIAQKLQAAEMLDEAAKYFETCVDSIVAAAKLEPKLQETRQAVYGICFQFSKSLLKQGKHRRVAELMTLANSFVPAGTAFHHLSADFLGQCILNAQKDDKLSKKEVAKLLDEYGKQAVEHLQRAIEAGFKDVNFLKKNRHFDPLRSRQDFQNVLKRLSPDQT